MNIEIREVHSRKQLREYIHFPEAIYRNDSHWVPPIYTDDGPFMIRQKIQRFNIRQQYV